MPKKKKEHSGKKLAHAPLGGFAGRAAGIPRAAARGAGRTAVAGTASPGIAAGRTSAR